MKRIGRFFFFLLFVTCLMTAGFFLLERYDGLGLAHEDLHPVFSEKDGHATLTWEPLSYPCFYKVEVLSKTTGLVDGEPTYHFLTGLTTRYHSVDLPSSAIPVYYRVTAFGLFGRVDSETPPVMNGIYAEDQKAPVTISHYDDSHPASLMPFLVWHTYPGAVCYEVELLSGPPDHEEGGTALSKMNHLESTRQVFTNGWQADLRKYQRLGKVWYRIRALGIHLQPLGEFSKAEPVTLDASEPVPHQPLINDIDRMPDFEQPLYPVYHWIPVHGVMRYEVQLSDHPMEDSPEDADHPPAWSKIVNSADVCYDEYPRLYAGDYYWRVRAVNAANQPISDWSATEHFVVKDHEGIKYAALGDSITHGGGAVSLPPSSLEYSYTTYLDQPCLNIGRSGDTSHTTLARFDTDVAPLHPQNLFILTGTNSLRTTDITAQQVIADLAGIREKCKEDGIRPIFLTLMPVNPDNIRYAFHTPTDPHWADKMKTINEWIRSQESFVDLEPYFYDPSGRYLDTKFSIDGLHPDILGKQLMAEVINQWLKVHG